MKIDKEMEEWLKRHAASSGEGMKKSSIFLALASNDSVKDALFCLQLGYAIMLNKPVVAMVEADMKVPPLLEKIATKIIRLDTKSEEDRARAFKELEVWIKQKTTN